MNNKKQIPYLLTGWLLLLVSTLVVFPGCKGKKHQAPPPSPPGVTVAEVKKETVPIFLDYIGSTVAVKSVDIRARVEGFLQARTFQEGADIKKGEVVFLIDPQPYEAALEKNRAQLKKDEAQVGFARLQVQRYKPLLDEDFVAKEQFDNYATELKAAEAAVAADRAAVKQTELNLSYCTMKSPLNGRIGRTYVNEGNLVGAGQDTLLATIVQLDPIYVTFSPSADDLRHIMKYKQEGRLPVNISFSDGSKYPHQGRVDFVDNTANAATSTVTMRAVVPNPDKVLLPGIYVNVDLYLTDVPDTILVPEKAVGEDQEGTYVYVVGPDNKVEDRKIEVTYSYQDMRVVKKGLKEGEQVITEGLQMVRAGMVVKPEKAAPEKSGQETPAGGPGDTSKEKSAVPAGPSPASGSIDGSSG